MDCPSSLPIWRVKSTDLHYVELPVLETSSSRELRHLGGSDALYELELSGTATCGEGEGAVTLAA